MQASDQTMPSWKVSALAVAAPDVARTMVPTAAKMIAPRYQGFDADELRRVSLPNGGEVRVVAGTVMGVLAMTGTVLRHRRELSRVRKELEQLKAVAAEQAAARTQAPAPDTLIEQIGL